MMDPFVDVYTPSPSHTCVPHLAISLGFFAYLLITHDSILSGLLVLEELHESVVRHVVPIFNLHFSSLLHVIALVIQILPVKCLIFHYRWTLYLTHRSLAEVGTKFIEYLLFRTG
jgi:hypothetical protein